MDGGRIVNLAVGTSRYLELLARLKHRLGILGVPAEVREHLMSLVVFRPALRSRSAFSSAVMVGSIHGTANKASSPYPTLGKRRRNSR
jgi:hypothetical protein